ncbi:MAG: O-acetyl-ADP-ribose deacetylase [Gammaproteobacteria bacterium]|nr:MAG: O-acetyl-ADP-ribose deacetylase [Gammaproteobacteria bacterium]
MKIDVVKGDITRIEVDAIVNAANTALLGGGGVDGAIHRVGGSQILSACKIIRERQGGCPVGQAVITTAGNLPAKKVIHTVGPRWRGGNHDEVSSLTACYENCLKVAEKNGLTTVAFPNISTGVYHFPKALAAKIAITTVSHWQSDVVKKVIFVCFDAENFSLYQTERANTLG